MPEITPNTFPNYAQALSEIADELVQEILELQAKYAEAVADNPGAALRLQRQLQERFNSLIATWTSQSISQVRSTLPSAYLRGLEQINAQARELGIDLVSNDIPLGQLLAPRGINITPPHPPAIRLLERYPQHLTMYQVFEAAAEQDIYRMRLPILRSSMDAIRQIAIESGRSEYREANEFTRRQMSQEILNRFSDRGITGMIDTSGRRWKLDTYAEMTARTQTANAARQAAMNRQQQYGLDLVRISSHSPCSTLCYPWQGKVYSITGKSRKYPPLQEAILGGLFHSNCKHSSSAYIPGVSEPLENPGRFSGDKQANRRAYKIEQEQRYNERMIRKWKHRLAVAIVDEERGKAKAKIRAYQARNRELVQEHNYLRRKYERESVTATGRRTG